MRALILNGPNLNMLGFREPEIYGHETLQDLENLCLKSAQDLGLAIDLRQSNHEGDLVDWIQALAREKTHDGLVINAGAFTHTSIALHDALRLLDIPIIEVHISDPKTREAFRHTSYIEPLASAVIAGKGIKGYGLALQKMAEILAGGK